VYRKKDVLPTRLYNYYVSGHYPSSCFNCLKTQRFGDLILSLSSGGTTELCPVGRASPYLQAPEPTQDEIYKLSTT
jgi:hypothetical protein